MNTYSDNSLVSFPVSSQESRVNLYIQGLVLLFLGVLVYLPSIKGVFIWDDYLYITANRFMYTSGGLKDIWFLKDASHQYYPLVSTTFWLEWRLWGQNPAGYHAFNIILHVLNGLLLWTLCRRISITGAFVIALVFVLHPVNVESVAWITERKNVLSAFFYFTSLLSFLSFTEKRSSYAYLWYVLSLVLFACALLSKTVSSTLPVAIIILIWGFGELQGKKQRWLRIITALAPFFMLGIATGLYTAWWEVSQVGALSSMGSAGKVVLSGRAVWFYLAKFVFPYRLIFIYPRWSVDPAVVFQWLYTFGAILLLGVLFFLRRLIGRAPVSAYALFLVTIFPALGFFDIYFFRFSFVADHFFYLATPAVSILVVGSIWRLLEARAATIKAPVAVLIVAVLASMSFYHAGTFKGPERLWRATIEANPEAWMAHSNLALELIDADKLTEAMEHLQTSLRLNPDDPDTLGDIGLILKKQGRPALALKYYRRVLDIAPAHVNARYNMAILLAGLGKRRDAIQEYRRVLRVREDNPYPHNNLAVLLLQEGHLDEAVTHFERAVQLNPLSERYKKNLSRAREIREKTHGKGK